MAGILEEFLVLLYHNIKILLFPWEQSYIFAPLIYTYNHTNLT